MKKQILATLALAVSLFAAAKAETRKDILSSLTSKSISINNSFDKVVIDGNMDVVLYEDNEVNAGTISVFGSETQIQSVKTFVKDGVLIISRKANAGEKALVYVPVKNISEIEAKGNAKVTTSGVLNSKLLTLFVNGDCKINVQAAGTISIVQGDVSELRVDKNVTIRQSTGKP